MPPVDLVALTKPVIRDLSHRKAGWGFDHFSAHVARTTASFEKDEASNGGAWLCQLP
jgi:hypothetical protein